MSLEGVVVFNGFVGIGITTGIWLCRRHQFKNMNDLVLYVVNRIKGLCEEPSDQTISVGAKVSVKVGSTDSQRNGQQNGSKTKSQ